VMVGLTTCATCAASGVVANAEPDRQKRSAQSNDFFIGMIFIEK